MFDRVIAQVCVVVFSERRKGSAAVTVRWFNDETSTPSARIYGVHMYAHASEICMWLKPGTLARIFGPVSPNVFRTLLHAVYMVIEYAQHTQKRWFWCGRDYRQPCRIMWMKMRTTHKTVCHVHASWLSEVWSLAGSHYGYGLCLNGSHVWPDIWFRRHSLLNRFDGQFRCVRLDGRRGVGLVMKWDISKRTQTVKRPVCWLLSSIADEMLFEHCREAKRPLGTWTIVDYLYYGEA